MMLWLYVALKSFSQRLQARLDGKVVCKEEFRKVGLMLMGLGLTGPFINGKTDMWPFAVLGAVLEILGLIEDLPTEGDDV